MNLTIINAALIGVVALVALSIMVYWHVATRGAWRNYPSGRSLMGLLVIIFLITLNAAVQWMIPLPREIKAPFYFALYLVFAWSLAGIGFSIRREIIRGNAKADHPSSQIKEDVHE